MKLFHHCVKQFSTNLLIIQIQWLNSNTPIIPYIEIYKSYNINDYFPQLRQDILWKFKNYTNSMTIFHHCGMTCFGKLKIIQIQWLHSTSAVNPYREIYKSYNIHDYIPPLRQNILWKITNYTNSITKFHRCRNPLYRKIHMIQH